MTGTTTQIDRQTQQIPLIESPFHHSITPILLPPDIHPLPLNVTDYFVYPYTLEAHTLSTLPTTLSTLQSTRAKREQYLLDRKEKQEREKREVMKRLAPGWTEGSSVMEPISAVTVAGAVGVGEHKDVRPLSSEEEEKGEEERKLEQGIEGLIM